MNTEAMDYAEGKFIDHTPSTALTAGQMLQVGGAAAMAATAVAASVKGAVQVKGLIKVAAAAVTGNIGDAVWWDEDGDSDYGDASGHTRVSAFNTWIDEILSGGGNGGGNGKPDKPDRPGRPPRRSGDASLLGGGTVVPEPSMLWMMAAGGLCLMIGWRRRRRA